MAGTETICRISVQSHKCRVDLCLPADTPLGVLLPDVLEILDIAGPDGDAHRWQLSPIGKAPLALTQSLHGCGIRDGETLLLTAAEVSLPPPRFDDVTEAVLTAVDARPRWTVAARRAAGTTAAVWSCLLGVVVLLQGGLVGPHAASLAAPAVAAGVAFAGAIAAGRVYRVPTASTALGLCSIVFGSAAGYLAVPGPAVLPKAVLAAAVGTTLAILALRVGGEGTTALAACGTCGALTTAVLAVALLVALPLPTAGAVLLAAAIASVLVAPRLAVAVTRVPLPDLQGEHPSAEVDDRAGRAAATLSGLVCGGVAATVIGSALVATQASGMAIATLAATILMLRARFHVDCVQVTALIAGGTICLTSALLRAQLCWPAASVWFFAVAAGLASVAFALGWAPPASPTPSVRRCVDVVEYLALAAVIPAACWVCGVYGTVRGMRLS